MARKSQEKLSKKMFDCAGSGFKGKPKKKKKRKNQTPEAKLLYIQLTISFLIGQKRTSSTCILYNNHLKNTQGLAGNHVMYDRGA